MKRVGLKAKPLAKRSKLTLQRSKKPRRRKGQLTKLKAELWDLCRKIQIKKYGNTCYCCGAVNLMGSNLHLGHFLPSSLCSVELRFTLDNLKPSCYRCNIHLSGNWPAYEAHLIKDGIDIAELKTRNEATKGTRYPQSWFENKITEYSALLTIE